MRGLTKVANAVDSLMVLVSAIAFFVFIGGACWHGYVFFKAWKWQKIEVKGAFKEIPTPGYVWQDDATNDIHLFWQNTNVVWKAGVPNPTYENVFSAVAEGSWTPKTGYVFIDGSKGLSVKWQAGIRLRDYKVTSTDREGVWKPLAGYIFIDAPNSLATAWKAGLKDPIGHRNFITGETEGSWVRIDTSSPADSLVKGLDSSPFTKAFVERLLPDSTNKR